MTSQFIANWWPATIFALIFFLTGLVVLSYPGIQNDEVLFAASVYQIPGGAVFDVTIFQVRVPVMHLTYLGALKTWVYAGILAIAPPSCWIVRVPVLLIGAVTIWLFVRLLGIIHGRAAAWIGGALLATDTMFLLTTCFDWGPVAFQHLLLVAGMSGILSFCLKGSRAALCLGFFCFGLGMWDKALFVWTLTGIAIAGMLVFPGELWRRLSWKNVGLATAGFLLGALPLVIYNCASGFATFRSADGLVFNEFSGKLRGLRGTWDGSALLGYLASGPDETAQSRDARTGIERVSVAVQTAFGQHSRNRLELAIYGALLLAPLWWRTESRRLLLFSLIAIAIAWLEMAITKRAGWSAHHVVLLWPIPHLFLAVAFAETCLGWRGMAARRLAACAVVVVVSFLALQNLLVTNQYLYQWIRYGSPRAWTDAIYPLADEVRRLQPSEVVIDDWGIFSPLVLLGRGKLPLLTVDQAFLATNSSEAQKNWDLGLLERGLWVGHTRAYQEFTAITDQVIGAAGAAGFRKQLIQTVSDGNGRPAFEIFRFVRAETR